MTATLAIDDPVLTRFASEVGDSGPVAVAGGRTRWGAGGPLSEGTRVIAAPTGIVAYAPEEMTVRVRAGTPVAELDDALAASGQRSALPDRGGTVGGALAVGDNDIRALGRGMVRAALLQVRYVSAEGRLVNSGGPTVKNVTGFDLPRLMVGALGTLGLLAEVILRTDPVPATSRWLMADGARPRDVLDTLLAPSAVLWDGTSTWVQIEGHPADVDAEQSALAAVGRFVETEGPPSLPANRWSVAPARIDGPDGPIGAGVDPGSFVAAAGLGLVFATNPPPPRPLAPEVAAVSRRVKHNFDPTGRLNPGREPGRR